jgi:HD superfamily phosphohydrolase YqeK
MRAMHPLVERAAAGELPAWAVASDERRAHARRVAELLDDWASGLGLRECDRARFRAAGLLHDALRDEDPRLLRPRLPPVLSDLPALILHGPAVAERLRVEGVKDGELLLAIAYHTLGHHRFKMLGRSLYAADFLEPGRRLADGWRAGLRARMPDELDEVVREILGARVAHLIEIASPLRAETATFWNALVKVVP